MTSQQATAVAAAAARSDLLESLLQIGIDLSVTRDRRQMWDTILSEARRLSGAEAASLYIRRGEHI